MISSANSKLATSADQAVLLASNDKSIITGSSEPNQVARLVTSLPHQLVKAWQPFVASGALTVSAAFCHAKPLVDWSSPFSEKSTRRSELGDLLIIFDTPDSRGVRIKRSLLIQAKISKTSSCSISSETELAQRYLYSHWPEMKLCGVPPALTAPDPLDISDCFSDGGQDIQARYAGVEVGSVVSPAWFLESGASTFPSITGGSSIKSAGSISLSFKSSLGSGLAEIYLGRLGRRCDLNDKWSELSVYLEKYVSKFVPWNPLPHVSVKSGISPLPLVAATTLFANKQEPFPLYTDTGHLIYGMREWVEPKLLEAGPRHSLLYHWPDYNISRQIDHKLEIDQPGFGIIRVAIDQPLVFDRPA